jgi:hypothetical protein
MLLGNRGRMPKSQGENAQGRRRGGAPGLQRSASEEKIGEEAAPPLGLILERSGEIPPLARQRKEIGVSHGRRLLKAEGRCTMRAEAAVRQDRSAAKSESTRSPKARCHYVVRDLGAGGEMGTARACDRFSSRNRAHG